MNIIVIALILSVSDIVYVWFVPYAWTDPVRSGICNTFAVLNKYEQSIGKMNDIPKKKYKLK